MDLAQIVALSTSKDEGDPSNAPFKAALERLLMPRPRTGESAMAPSLSMMPSDLFMLRHDTACAEERQVLHSPSRGAPTDEFTQSNQAAQFSSPSTGSCSPAPPDFSGPSHPLKLQTRAAQGRGC